MIPCCTILHPTVAAVQHSFQLCQQKSPLYFFCTCNLMIRTTCDNQKKMFYHHLLTWRHFLFSMQYEYVGFPYVLQLEIIPYTRKSLIIHIKIAFIWNLCFLDASFVKALDDHNCLNSSINRWRQNLFSDMDY